MTPRPAIDRVLREAVDIGDVPGVVAMAATDAGLFYEGAFGSRDLDTYYWLDPSRRVTGLILTQILPFADPRALAVYGRFERSVYGALGSA
jgi:hypothetical protein